MQAEFVQWESSIKAKCIFYVNVIRRHKSVSLSKRSNWISFVRQRRKELNKDIPKEVVAQLSGCSRAKSSCQITRRGGSIHVVVAEFPSLTLYLCILVCLRCCVFSAALLNSTTGPSLWSSGIAVPLPLLACLYLILFFFVI